MIGLKILYLPTARMTFDIEAAKKVFSQSVEYLNTICENVIAPKDLLTSVDDLLAFIDSQNTDDVALIVFQNVTFADGEFIKAANSRFNVPVIVWGVREPSVGGWLRLNSLTGVMSTANYLKNSGQKFSYVIGNPTEDELKAKLLKLLNVHQAIYKVKNLNMGVMGDYPPGFFFSDTNVSELKELFGVDIVKFSLEEAFIEYEKMPESDYKKEIKSAMAKVSGIDENDEKVIKFAKFTTYMKKLVKENNLESLAMRCWPNFFVNIDAAPCAILSHLTEDGIATSCEADIHGSLSMYILTELANKNAPYLGDVVNFDEQKNSIILWHCGVGAYSLANPKEGAKHGVHPNRKIGYALDFGIKEGKVTLFRVSYSKNGYRLIALKGNALDVPNSYNGTSGEICLDSDVTEFLNDSVLNGFEPHFALVHGDVLDEIVEIGRLLNIETITYKDKK